MIRQAKKEDAAKLIEVMQICYEETEYLNNGKGDFSITIEDEIKWIEKNNQAPRTFFGVIELEGEIVGTIGLHPVSHNHYFRHEVSIGIAIVKKAWHQGLAREAFTIAIEKAKEFSYEMITLGVYEPNIRAIALYESFGFEEYGRLKHKKKFIDGRYFDEILMVKYL